MSKRADELKMHDRIVIDGVAAKVECVTAGESARTCTIHYLKPERRRYSREVLRDTAFDVVPEPSIPAPLKATRKPYGRPDREDDDEAEAEAEAREAQYTSWEQFG